MQRKFRSCDGSLDLPQEITDAHDIEVVPFMYHLTVRLIRKK